MVKSLCFVDLSATQLATCRVPDLEKGLSKSSSWSRTSKLHGFSTVLPSWKDFKTFIQDDDYRIYVRKWYQYIMIYTVYIYVYIISSANIWNRQAFPLDGIRCIWEPNRPFHVPTPSSSKIRGVLQASEPRRRRDAEPTLSRGPQSVMVVSTLDEITIWGWVKTLVPL